MFQLLFGQSPFIERYYFINLIPGREILGVFDHFYFYSCLVLIGIIISVLILFNRKKGKRIDHHKILLYSIVVIWLVTSLSWLITEADWLTNDWRDFQGQDLFSRRSTIAARVLNRAGLGPEWNDFYPFWEWVKEELPSGVRVHFLPAAEHLGKWGQFWLYPDQLVVNESQPADFLVAFDVKFKEITPNLSLFKKFAPYKFIMQIK